MAVRRIILIRTRISIKSSFSNRLGIALALRKGNRVHCSEFLKTLPLYRAGQDLNDLVLNGTSIRLYHQSQQRHRIHVGFGWAVLHDDRHVAADEDGVYAIRGHVSHIGIDEERITPAKIESAGSVLGVCDASIQLDTVDRTGRRRSECLHRGRDFGRNGLAYRETDVETADLETTIAGLMAGEYSNPIRVIVFYTAERWSQDVSEDVAHEVRQRCDLQSADVPSAIQDFERHEGHTRQLSLRLG